MSYRDDLGARNELSAELRRKHDARKVELQRQRAELRKVLKRARRAKGGLFALTLPSGPPLAGKPWWYVALYFVLLVVLFVALGFLAGAMLAVPGRSQHTYHPIRVSH
jgi:hypothetical protein